jgi:hypothetical protein
MSNTVYEATPRKVREYVVDALSAGLVPIVKGPPGIGKSAIMRSISNEFNLEMIDHRASTSQPEDFTGLPDFDRSLVDIGGPVRATFRPFDIFPIAGTPMPLGKDGWLLFMDEFNSAEREVQAASYKLILDKKSGQFPLHEKVLIAAAGNRSIDKAIVNDLGTAMQSRLVHIQMIISFNEWFEDVALAEGYDERTRGYLSWKGEKSLMNFRPDHDDETFACPRTWEFQDRLIRGKTFAEVTEPDPRNPGRNHTYHQMDGKTGLYAGTIGQAEAASFVQYCKVTKDLVTIDIVAADPLNAKVHNLAEMCYAQVTHLVDKTEMDNFAEVVKYIARYEVTYQVIYYQALAKLKPQLNGHPAKIKASIELARYLYD